MLINVLFVVVYFVVGFGILLGAYHGIVASARKVATRVPFMRQTRGQYCYGARESARRAKQITTGYLTVANGLER